MMNLLSYPGERKKNLCSSTSENSMKKTLYFYLLINLLNMKKVLISTVVFLLSLAIKGQAPFPDKDEIKQFMASKTCVVLENDPFSSFNSYIKEAMKNTGI